MTINLNLKFVISFLALLFVMHEAHEIVHTTVGRIICGCWGQRDFNSWDVCEGCEEKHPISLISTFAGPVFTFIMIWWGSFLLNDNNSNAQKSWGFALVFANMPFARILNAILGMGDEVFAINKLINNHNLAWAIGLIIILLITIYPLFKAFKIINNKRKIGYFLLFFLMPLVLDVIIVEGLMNALLGKGVLSNYWILGSPMLVTFWTALATITFLIFRKSIYTLAD
jgi:hypothetical protein